MHLFICILCSIPFTCTSGLIQIAHCLDCCNFVVSFENDKIGVYLYNSETDEYFSYFNEKLPTSYHGTGDIYASSALGAIMRGLPVEKALSIAVDFTLECIKETAKDEDRRFYGVNFESALPFYIEKIKEALNA